ncbi:MAG: hypothetical protein COS85_06920 [Armatimonadetes bacterium CG07_land_8_20_14_0_80_59_28]|nr:MAG: hypothetical protein COS85_06920 [Armatimonadetes bacterium CG07_land_8_20_14_0_80_59_28]PIX43464.1 MAG: hypothetical protein COZ56_07120 [Armatimonadetes bacterium CG_4_8_14_3_um_filter_58_9]PIY49466.1 MAG: hypothetical protein COZ05_00375 [Armatimonadetes bacterium CG_4_10_14_3_um_filter_59_10]
MEQRLAFVRPQTSAHLHLPVLLCLGVRWITYFKSLMILNLALPRDTLPPVDTITLFFCAVYNSVRTRQHCP